MTAPVPAGTAPVVPGEAVEAAFGCIDEPAGLPARQAT